MEKISFLLTLLLSNLFTAQNNKECPTNQNSVLENNSQKNEISAFNLIRSEESVYNIIDHNCSEMRYSILLFDNFSRGS